MRGAARLATCALLLAALGEPAAALAQSQAPPPRRTTPPTIKYGKWVAFGLAAGFATLGAVTHERADSRYDDLLHLCRGGGSCTLEPTGRYADPDAENLYRRVVSADRGARQWILGSQAALLGGAVLFVMELSRKGGPENIPFSPYIVAGPSGTLLGVRLSRR